MSYYAKVVRPDEAVRFHARLHWVIYLRGGLLLALAAVLLVAWLPMEAGSPPRIALAAAAILALLLGGASLLSAWMRQTTTEIVVTDRRVITRTGLLGRHTVEMSAARVETVDVVQGLTARLLGYGTVLVRGAGEGLQPLARVAQPLSLRNAILVG